MKEYGTPDPDDTAYRAVIKHVEGLEVAHILHHQRVPINARMCRLPQSLKVQAVLVDGSVITYVQMAPGRAAKLQ